MHFRELHAPNEILPPLLFILSQSSGSFPSLAKRRALLSLTSRCVYQSRALHKCRSVCRTHLPGKVLSSKHEESTKENSRNPWIKVKARDCSLLSPPTSLFLLNHFCWFHSGSGWCQWMTVSWCGLVGDWVKVCAGKLFPYHRCGSMGLGHRSSSRSSNNSVVSEISG